VDTEDDLQPLVASMFRDALRAVTLLAAAAADARLDASRMEARAVDGGTTFTELADHLVRAHDLPFRAAHAVARGLLEARSARPAAPLGALLAEVSAAQLGSPLAYTDAETAEILSPRHFVAVRRTHGGPAPDEVSTALRASDALIERDTAWVARMREALEAADARLTGRSRAL
jgi:argininosuccinate lyase